MAEVDYVQRLLDKVKDLPMFKWKTDFNSRTQKHEIDLYSCRYQLNGPPRIHRDLTKYSDPLPSERCLTMVRDTQTFQVSYDAVTRYDALKKYRDLKKQGLEGFRMAIEVLNVVMEFKKSLWEWKDDNPDMPNTPLTTDCMIDPWHAISRLSMMVEHLVDSDPRRQVFMLK
jgi:hypothetical protein